MSEVIGLFLIIGGVLYLIILYRKRSSPKLKVYESYYYNRQIFGAIAAIVLWVILFLGL